MTDLASQQLQQERQQLIRELRSLRLQMRNVIARRQIARSLNPVNEFLIAGRQRVIDNLTRQAAQIKREIRSIKSRIRANRMQLQMQQMRDQIVRLENALAMANRENLQLRSAIESHLLLQEELQEELEQSFYDQVGLDGGPNVPASGISVQNAPDWFERFGPL